MYQSKYHQTNIWENMLELFLEHHGQANPKQKKGFTILQSIPGNSAIVTFLGVSQRDPNSKVVRLWTWPPMIGDKKVMNWIMLVHAFLSPKKTLERTKIFGNQVMSRMILVQVSRAEVGRPAIRVVVLGAPRVGDLGTRGNSWEALTKNLHEDDGAQMELHCGGNSKIFWNFHPEPWWKLDPIWLAHIFQVGLVNQPPTRVTLWWM